MNLPAMKAIFLTLLPAAVSFALTPPYLISALPKSDSSIVLQWRNNDIAATGFIVLRKEAGAAAFVPTDSVKNASQNSYTDQPLKDSTAYVYRLRAYNANSVSDTSNSLQATTYKKTVVQVFKRPYLYFSTYDYYSASKSVVLTIYDSSNCEEGFLIYRAEYRDGICVGSGMIGQITSADPLKMLPVSWNDDSVSINQSYKYKVCAYKSKDSVFSNEIAVYTGKAPPLHYLVRFNKKGECPINYMVWSAKAGDSIILKEKPSPAQSYSVINIKDISKPFFAGYIDSVKLLDYPVATLIPVFMKYNVANICFSTSVLSWGNRIIMVKNGVLTLHEVQGIDLILRDSLKSVVGYLIPAFEDSMVLAYGSNVRPVRLNGSKLTAMDTICFDNFVKYMMPRGYDFHCFTNNKIYFTAYESLAPGQIYSHTYLLDLNYKPPALMHLKFDFPPLANTGLYFSNFKNICLAEKYPDPKETRLLAIDPRNPQSWQIAEKSKAIYRDTVNPSQNLRNIILDSLSKNLFLFYTNKLVILGYEYDSTYNGTKLSGSPQARHRGGLTVYRDFFRGKSAVLFFPSVAGAAVSVFDLRGRLVRQMERVYSAERIDVPEAQAGAVYVVGVVVEGRRYAARVMFGR